MKPYYALKHQAKVVRWHARRRKVGARVGSEVLAGMPVVMGTAIPKAGSHLINQVLQSLPKIGPFVSSGFFPVNRGEDNSKLSADHVLAKINLMQPGDIGYGYLHYEEPFITALTTPNRATIFVYRDPRDVVVSAMKYATYMNSKHGLHTYMNERLENDEARLNSIIAGIPEADIGYSSIAKRYAHYIGWLSERKVLSLRFEELVNARENTIKRILAYLSHKGFELVGKQEDAVNQLVGGIKPEKSGTFRKGLSGGWREIFSPKNKETFKQTTGDLLIQLGYEQNQDW
ncbi:MAG: sulfotransferase domain-containing protein [Chloroflexota bacterium]